MIINGLQKLTLLDFPGYTACTVFTLGCNLRCPFCHNKNLVIPEHFNPSDIIPEETIFQFLKERKSKLQGICITGGEPTIQYDLKEFIQQVKQIGYKVKLDTNGTNPDVLYDLLQEDLLDYVAMDIKNSPKTYNKTTGNNIHLDQILQSIGILKNSKITYEFRTTVVKELHNKNSFTQIASILQNVPLYSLQYYEQTSSVISPEWHTPSDQEMKIYQKIMQTCASQVIIKGR